MAAKRLSIGKVKKRDGRVVEFDYERIASAIFKAAESVGGSDKKRAENLAEKVVDKLEVIFDNKLVPTVEQIQDMVEQVLIKEGHARTAKAYILYRAKKGEERERRAFILGGAENAEKNLNFSENSLRVLERRYLLKDDEGNLIETPEDMVRRIASNIASADKNYGEDAKKTEEKFYNMISELEFMPNSPTIMNAGTDIQQLSACFVLPVDDSMEGIFKSLTDAALIHKSGGGTGFSFSRLRPKNDLVKSTAGVASGPVSFMRIFDVATDVIKQGGKRRGANMGILRVDHPDIIDFINCKNDMVSYTNFNISVAATDAFMDAVVADDYYDLLSPRTREPIGKYKARNIFNMMIQNAWKNGDPGMIFLDEINRKHPAKNVGEIESTNPCIVGSSLVSTEKGLMKMEEVVEEYGALGINIVCDTRISSGSGRLMLEQLGVQTNRAAKAWKTGIKDTFKMITESGYELVATADHKILTKDGWKELKELKVTDKVIIQSGEGMFNSDYHLGFNSRYCSTWNKELGEMMGWLVGDGWLRDADKESRVGFVFSKDDKDIMDHMKPLIDTLYGKDIKPVERKNGVWHLSYHSPEFVRFFMELGVKPVKAADKTVPESIFMAPKESVAGFLRGLYSADGTVSVSKNKTHYIRLTSKSEKLLKGVQMLLINLGIKSKIYERHRKKRVTFKYKTVRGEIRLYESDGILYELQVSKDMIPLFLSEIGFMCGKHSKKIEELEKVGFYKTRFEDRVVAVEENGKEVVYDLTEENTHSFIANGIVIHNCGEQPLLPYESCNLGSINLHKFLSGDKTTIDWDRLKERIEDCVHFLDNVIDMNKLPVEELNVNNRRTRKIGLGLMGFADLLYELGIPYDSDEGLAMAEKIMKFFMDTSYAKSMKLSETRGVFPAWKGSDHEKAGRKMRNACCLTIAPTGTIGMIAEASGGCEPNFAISYIKNVMDGTELVYTNKIFERIAKQKGFYDPELMRKIARAGTIQGFKEEIPADVRRVFVTAQDIAPEWHIRMQAAFQKYVDSSISKTINFPSNATIEDVEKSYLLAYKLKCKGITIYRDKSRENQVLNIGEVNKKKGAMEKAFDEKKELEKLSKAELLDKGICPDCKAKLAMEEGCAKCHSCGFSVCSV